MKPLPLWLPNAHVIPSPNCDFRPDPLDVSLVVIHNISLPAGQFATGFVQQLFCNTLDCRAHDSFADLENLKVSSHFFIDRQGRLQQFVPINYRAWHAGVSEFNGRSDCNDFSIGIELEGTDTLAYTNSQYNTLALLTEQLMAIYPAINRHSIVGHEHIAPGRKTDPGKSFAWQRYFAMIDARYCWK